MSMKFETFEQFEAFMKNVANINDTIVEVKNYDQYGWWGASFMTDHFGGVYTNICYLVKEGEMYNHIHSEHEKKITDAFMLGMTVAGEKHECLAHRDLQAVGDFINSQYD